MIPSLAGLAEISSSASGQDGKQAALVIQRRRRTTATSSEQTIISNNEKGRTASGQCKKVAKSQTATISAKQSTIIGGGSAHSSGGCGKADVASQNNNFPIVRQQTPGPNFILCAGKANSNDNQNNHQLIGTLAAPTSNKLANRSMINKTIVITQPNKAALSDLSSQHQTEKHLIGNVYANPAYDLNDSPTNNSFNPNCQPTSYGHGGEYQHTVYSSQPGPDNSVQQHENNNSAIFVLRQSQSNQHLELQTHTHHQHLHHQHHHQQHLQELQPDHQNHHDQHLNHHHYNQRPLVDNQSSSATTTTSPDETAAAEDEAASLVSNLITSSEVTDKTQANDELNVILTSSNHRHAYSFSNSGIKSPSEGQQQFGPATTSSAPSMISNMHDYQRPQYQHYQQQQPPPMSNDNSTNCHTIHNYQQQQVPTSNYQQQANCGYYMIQNQQQQQQQQHRADSSSYLPTVFLYQNQPQRTLNDNKINPTSNQNQLDTGQQRANNSNKLICTNLEQMQATGTTTASSAQNAPSATKNTDHTSQNSSSNASQSDEQIIDEDIDDSQGDFLNNMLPSMSSFIDHSYVVSSPLTLSSPTIINNNSK